VKPAPRWPLHPAPREGEALSSWLNRVALCYHMEVSELLEHDLGHDQVDDLDTAPPLSLLAMLSQRSGIELNRLRCMSFAGWVPWLLDSLDDQIPAALETYAFQLSVLLPRLRRKTRSITSWRAWLPSQPINRACPLCLNDPENQAVLLAWKLPLMLSCPLHGCWLESYWGVPGRFLGWENADAAPRTASDAIAAMDRRTWQALTTGHVELPRRRIHAGLWFRLLRTLLDELNTPLSRAEPAREHPPCLGRLRASAARWAKSVATLRDSESGGAVADAGGGGNRHQLDRGEGYEPARRAGKAVLVRAANRVHQWPAGESAEARTRRSLAACGQGHR
jgi:hypothetical protein